VTERWAGHVLGSWLSLEVGQVWTHVVFPLETAVVVTGLNPMPEGVRRCPWPMVQVHYADIEEDGELGAPAFLVGRLMPRGAS
jgi:hypothetical protein